MTNPGSPATTKNSIYLFQNFERRKTWMKRKKEKTVRSRRKRNPVSQYSATKMASHLPKTKPESNWKESCLVYHWKMPTKGNLNRWVFCYLEHTFHKNLKEHSRSPTLRTQLTTSLTMNDCITLFLRNLYRLQLLTYSSSIHMYICKSICIIYQYIRMAFSSEVISRDTETSTFPSDNVSRDVVPSSRFPVSFRNQYRPPPQITSTISNMIFQNSKVRLWNMNGFDRFWSLLFMYQYIINILGKF